MRYKKILSLMLVFALSFTPLSYIHAQSISPLTDAALQKDRYGSATVAAIIPAGEGEGKVKVLPHVEGDTPEGPEAFAVTDDETFYILDSLQSQIVVADSKGVIKTISLVDFTYPRDILLTDEAFYVLDSNAWIGKVDFNGTLMGKYNLPENMGSLMVRNLIEENGQVGFITIEDQKYFISNVNEISKGKSVLAKLDKQDERIFDNKTFKKDNSLNSSEFTMEDNAKISITSDEMIGSSNLIKSDADNAFIYVEEVATNTPYVIVESSIREYNKKGELIGASRLPLDECDSVPSNPVEITKKQGIYYLVPTGNSVLIYQIKLGSTYERKLKQLKEEAIAKYADDQNINVSDPISITSFSSSATATTVGFGTPLSRSDTRLRAVTMANAYWSWNPSKYDYYPNGTARYAVADARPTQLSATTSHYSTGIPYLWGGWDSPWTVTTGSPWTSFSTALTYYSTKGPLVGDTSSGKGPSGDTNTNGWGAGIDCSGFVAAALGCYSTKPNTSTIPNDAKALSNVIGNSSGTFSFSGMQPMDIFNKADSHVLFFDKRDYNGGGVYTYESTTGTGNITGDNTQGAKAYYRLWSELNGYSTYTWWAKETGDDFDVPLTTTGSAYLINGQTKYYSFVHSSSVTSSRTITLTCSTGNSDLFVFNSSRTLLASSKNTGTTTDTVTLTLTPGQTIYVAVYSAASGGYYTLSKSW